MIPHGLWLGGVPPMLTDGRQKIKQTLTFFSVEREALANRSDVVHDAQAIKSVSSLKQGRAEQARQSTHDLYIAYVYNTNQILADFY